MGLPERSGAAVLVLAADSPSATGVSDWSGRRAVGTTAIGSPPKGSSTTIAQPTKIVTVSPKRAAAPQGKAIGNAGRFLSGLSWPRGALRSSAATFKPSRIMEVRLTSGGKISVRMC